MVIALVMAAVFFAGLIVGVVIAALGRSAAYNDGYNRGFLDASNAPPFVLSKNSHGPGDDLAHHIHERRPR